MLEVYSESLNTDLRIFNLIKTISISLIVCFLTTLWEHYFIIRQLFFESPTVIPAAWGWSLPPAPPPPPILFSAVVIGLYSADIAGLLGGIGGGIPLFPIEVEVDDEALAYFI